MTTVIPFAQSRAALRRKAGRAEPDAASPRASAAILFFTGVRYERQSDPDRDAPQGKRQARACPKSHARTAAAGLTA